MTDAERLAREALAHHEDYRTADGISYVTDALARIMREREPALARAVLELTEALRDLHANPVVAGHSASRLLRDAYARAARLLAEAKP